MRYALIVLALVATALAGCADAPAETAPGGDFQLDDDLEATDTTGIIRGVVVDGAIVPIPDVAVVLADGTTTTTNQNGAFGFDGLEPGSYFLTASKLGFNQVQSSATVVAGDDAPPVVKVILERDPTFNPYSATRQHQGYYQCGLAFVVVCGAPNTLLGEGTAPDTSTWTFMFETQPTHVQTEMVWESTQSVSPDLRLEVEMLDPGCTGGTLIGNTLGASPLRMPANETQLQEGGVGGSDCGLYHSVFAGDILEQQHCFAWGSVPLVKCGVGFSVEQQFEWFVTEFYGYAPQKDWWFINDGALPPPA